MDSIRVTLAMLLLLSHFFASAKDVTDTLYSAKGDRVIVTYNIVQKGKRVSFEVENIRKHLGDYHRGKYGKEVDKVLTMFFDGIGSGNEVRFTGETPGIITLPSKASYTNSSDGYFVIEQHPTLSFDLEDAKGKSFTIPIYLAHYERKQHYKILCSCGNLEVVIPTAVTKSSTASSSSTSSKKQPSRKNSVELIETGEEFDESQEQALNLIKSIYKDLPEQNSLPISSTLQRKIDNLVDLQSKIKNEDVCKKIDEVFDAYNAKVKELQIRKDSVVEKKTDDDDFNRCSTKEAYEQYLKQHPNGSHIEEAKAKIDELDAKAKEEEAQKKRRNVLMIIGGALLAILLFIGNQAMQSFRNIRTQRSMIQMQQDAAKRAQIMAQSKAKSEIRKQTNKTVGQVKKIGQTAVRDTANKVKNKGNKRMSI